MGWKRLTVFVIILSFFIVFGCSEDTEEPPTEEPIVDPPAEQPVDDPSLPLAPDFTLLDTELKEVSLKDYNGKVLLLDFWATWCKPCEEEVPIFIQLYNQYRAQGFEMVGISLDEDGLKAIEPFAKKIGVNYTILLAQPGLVEKYNVSVIPSAFLINRHGRLVKRFDGAQGDKVPYEEALKKLL